MGLMVRSEIESGFGDADCKDRKDNEGGDGQVFDAATFHGADRMRQGGGRVKTFL